MATKSNKTKRKLAAGAAATVTAASMLVNHVVTDQHALVQADTMTDHDGSSHVLLVDGIEKRSYVIETEQYEPLSWRERATVWIQSLPLWIRAGVFMPLWGIGEVLNTLISGLVHSPVGKLLTRYLLEVMLLAGLIVFVWRLLFPNVPLKKIFSKKSVPWLLGAALLITMTDFILGMVWDKWNIWRIILMAATGLGMITLIWWRVFHKLPVPQPQKRKVELTVS